jgi:hypothetical protein
VQSAQLLLATSAWASFGVVLEKDSLATFIQIVLFDICARKSFMPQGYFDWDGHGKARVVMRTYIEWTAMLRRGLHGWRYWQDLCIALYLNVAVGVC